MVEFPAAAPAQAAVVADVAIEFTSPENVYLFRTAQLLPNAKIANVPVGNVQFPAATACICWFRGQTPEYGEVARVLNALRMLPI